MSMNLNSDPRGGTFCHSKAGLAIGDGAKTGPAIVAPNGAGIDFSIDGIMYHKAEAATVLPLTAAAVQAIDTTCLYLMCVNASGTVTSVKGTAVLTSELEADVVALAWPEPTAGTCPFGAVKIVTDHTHTFTAGTTALDAAGITETYYDLMSIPVNPLKA
jgi:hypothetical protein